MNEIFNASYRFSLGGVNFQIDIDDTLSAEQAKRDFPVTKDKVLHEHPFYELFFVFDDEIEIVFENNTKKYQNSIVCLPPNNKHYTIRSSDCRILLLPGEKDNSRGDFERFISEFFSVGGVRHIPATSPGIKGYLGELSKLFYGQKSEIDREITVSVLKCILHGIYSLYSDSAAARERDHHANESRYIIISSHITRCTTRGNEVTLSSIADALCLSKKQASRLIAKYYGKPLSKIITDEKLNYAAYLLKKTDRSVYDIAFESNFNSYSYFCRCFKERFGCVPLRYRSRE